MTAESSGGQQEQGSPKKNYYDHTEKRILVSDPIRCGKEIAKVIKNFCNNRVNKPDNDTTVYRKMTYPSLQAAYVKLLGILNIKIMDVSLL
jgi:hypothetical protein